MKKTVPFSIRNVFQGFAESEGILSADSTHLRFEFQIKDNVVGLLKSDLKSVAVPLESVEEISFRKGWFGFSLIIRVAEMRTMSELPNIKCGEIALSIAKRHSKAAADFVSSVQITTERMAEKPPVLDGTRAPKS